MIMKRKLLLLTISLLLFTLIFSACSGSKKIDSMKITDGLAREVEVGATLDTSKVTVEVTYNDKTTEIVGADQLTFSQIDTSKVGKQKLTITYQDFSITVDITVKAPEIKDAELVGISITKNFETELFVGTPFDISQITVIATYDDNSTKTIPNAELTVTPIDTTTEGEKTLTVTFNGMSATATITVKPVLLTEITFDATSFTNWSAPDLTAIKLIAHYNNGTTKDIPNAEIEFVTDNSGELPTLTAKWGGKEVTVTLKVPTLTGIRITAYTAKGYQNLAYVSSVTALAIYDNNDSLAQAIPTAELTISTIDTATAGNQTLTVTWNGMSATATVQIIGVKSISIDAGTVNGGNKELNLGATLDTSVIKVTVTYEDGTNATATSGVTFNTVDTMVAGGKTLTATYCGKEATYAIVVIDREIWGVDLPIGLASFKTNAKAFKDQSAPYRVGDDNAFRFELILKLWDEEKDQPSSALVPYVSSSKVYLIEGTEETLLTGNALSAMVVIDEKKHTFDFTEAAVGKTFRIETSPLGTLVDPDACVASLTCEVVNAYNIYDAKELNIITNEDDKDLFEHGQTSKSQLQAVNDFLANNGITRPENLSGVVFHSNITITMDDLPSEYFYHYTSSHFGPTKHFLDHFSVYAHVVTADAPTFTMYGNYNTLYTYKLPVVCDVGIGDNYTDEPASNSELISFDIHESLWSQDWTGEGYSSRIENLSMYGDDPNDVNEANSEKHMRSLAALKTYMVDTTVYNTRIEKFLISVCAEGDNQTLTVEKCRFFNTWMNHLFLWGTNIVNDRTVGDNVEPLPNYKPITVKIIDSSMTKCGGPAIIAAYGDVGTPANKLCGVDVHADANSEIWTYVTGQEAWFRAFGISEVATTVLSFNQSVVDTANRAGVSASITSKNNPGMQGVESANLIFCNLGPRGKFVYDGYGTIDMQNPLREALLNTPFAIAPMLMSSAGGAMFSNVDFTLFNPLNQSADNKAKFLQGNAFNFYIYAPDISLLQHAGLMVQYYH